MVGSFYIHLLSNTKSVEDNKTSSFTVRLPKKLEFNSTWRVGLMNIIYPYSWPNIGTQDNQYIDVYWKDRTVTRLKMPTTDYRTVDDLLRKVNSTITGWQETLCVIRGPNDDTEDEPTTKRSKRNQPDSYEVFKTSLERVIGDPNLDPVLILKDSTLPMFDRLMKGLRALKASQDLRQQMQSKINSQHTTIDTLNTRIAGLAVDIANNNDEKRRLEMEKAKVQRTLDRVKQEKADIETRITAKQSEHDQLADSTGKRVSELEAEKRATAAERQKDQKEIERLRTELQSKTAEKDRLVQESTDQVKAKDDEIARINVTLDELKADIAVYVAKEQELERLQQEHQALITVKNNLQTEVNQLTEAKEQDEQTINELRGSVGRLQQQLKDTSADEGAKRQVVEAQLESAREELSKHESTMKHLNTTIAALRRRIGELERGSSTEDFMDVDVDAIPESVECRPAKGVANVEKFRTIGNNLNVTRDLNTERFVMKINDSVIEKVRLSDQLQFILGFDKPLLKGPRAVARYMPDLHGGIHSLFIYAPGLIEPTVVGDAVAPLLRVAKVKGAPGDMVEDTFIAPLYHKILEKTVTDVTIEICTAAERLVPFNWGDCILVLHFQKDVLY